MSFGGVIGQGAAIGMLIGAIKRGRVAASYLFAGEQGIGKRLAAVNFAKAVNCLDPVRDGGGLDCCDRCASCRKIDSGAHPDFLLLEPEGGVIKVDEIRRLEEALSLTPFEAATKAVVIDDAEAMNLSAANAFLKTLEEPAPNSLIILVSSVPDTLPATVRSRCLRVNFKPLSTTDCARVLGGQAEGGPRARLSMGRPGLALREDLVRRRDRFLASFARLAEKHPWKDRQDMEGWLDMSLVLLRDMAAFKVSGGPGALVNADAAGDIERMARGADLGVIIEGYEKLRRLRGSLVYNINRGIAWNYIGCVMRGMGAA